MCIEITAQDQVLRTGLGAEDTGDKKEVRWRKLGQMRFVRKQSQEIV